MNLAQVIKYKCCGKTFAACCEPSCYTNESWLGKLKEYVLRGDTIEMAESKTVNFQECKCVILKPMEKTKTTPFDPARWTPEMLVVDEMGITVRVLCVDGPIPEFPIVGIWSGKTSTYTDCAHPNQLRFVEPVTMVWINYFGNGKWATEHATKEDADDSYRSLLAYESDEDEKYDFRACFETEKTWNP